mgnify:CR=1 FL=1
MFLFKNQLLNILQQIPMEELSDEFKTIFTNLLNENEGDEEDDEENSIMIAESGNSDKFWNWCGSGMKYFFFVIKLSS